MAKSSLPLLLGGGAALLLMGSKKGKAVKGQSIYGVVVSSDCSQIRIVDEEFFFDYLRGGYQELIEKKPELTWIDVANKLFNHIAPNCEGFPSKPKNRYVFHLYVTIARQTIINMMIDDPVKNFIKIFKAPKMAEFSKWYATYMEESAHQIYEAPSNMVAFSADLEKIEIMPRFIPDVVGPYMKNAKEEGKLDGAVEAFAASHNAQVGLKYTLISNLPKDRPAVQTLYQKLEAAKNAVAG